MFVGSSDANIYAYALNGGNARIYNRKLVSPPSPAMLRPDYSLKPAY